MTNQETVDEVLGPISPDQAGRLANRLDRMARQVMRRALPAALDEALIGYGYTPEVARLVHHLEERTGDSREDVFRHALTLYVAALNAVDDGDRLAVLSPDDEIIREIVGIEVLTPASTNSPA